MLFQSANNLKNPHNRASYALQSAECFRVQNKQYYLCTVHSLNKATCRYKGTSSLFQVHRVTGSESQVQSHRLRVTGSGSQVQPLGDIKVQCIKSFISGSADLNRY